MTKTAGPPPFFDFHLVVRSRVMHVGKQGVV